MVTFARAYRQLVALACAVLCWWAPTYVRASLSHRAPLSFPDRAEHAAQEDIAVAQRDHHFGGNPKPTRRVGARDEGKAAAERRWVGAPPEKLLQVTNLMGDVHRYTRDLVGRVVKEETFDGRELAYAYTAGGQVEQITYPDGSNRRFEYSWTKSLLREFTHDTESEFLRDGVGRITQARITSRNETHVTTFERDEFGRVTAEIQQGKRIQYQRDIQGRVIRRTLPNGATTSYEFATDGSLDRLDHDGYRLELKRDKVGREVLRAGSRGAQIASGYDELDRLKVRAAGPLGEKKPTARRFYDYDKAGRVTAINDDRWGQSMYFYDPAGRLLESRQFRLMETFLHDPASSIIEYVTQSNDGDVAAISVFTRPSQRLKAEYGKGGRLLKKREWSYEYDARGRRIAKVRTLGGVEERTTYDWDGRDKLRTITKPDGTRLDYSYDVFGRRVSKTRSGGPLDAKRVEFLWDGEVLAWELDTERGPRAFVHEPGGFEPILQQQGGETYLCVNDHLGMPKELIDGEGRLAWAASHSAYGAVIETQGPADVEVDGGFVQSDGPRVESPFRLLGQVNDDDAELAWTRFRCFDADTGTWISTDPLGLLGGTQTYGFDGSPSAVVDPLGLSTRGGSCYQGVRDASAYLKAQGVPRHVRKQVLESFDRRTISVETAGPAQHGLRYYDGVNAQAKGRYLFETFPASRQSLALPPEWNQMTNITQYQVRPGSTMIKGAAAPQGPNYPGGQTQLFVPNLSDLT